MAYNDPYSNQDGQRPHYGGASGATEFNPYATQQQTHPSYDQSGTGYDNHALHYEDDAYSAPRAAPQRQATMRSFLTSNDDHTRPDFSRDVPPLPPNKTKESDVTSGFDSGEFSGQDKTYRNFEHYRTSYRENLWTRGGRGSCIARFCCCTLLIFIFLFVSIVLSLALWIRPPAISLGDVTPTSTGGGPVQLQESGVVINLGVNISVANPNYFSVNFKEIKAEIIYPIGDTPIGGGSAKDISFNSFATTNVTFPFKIEYQTSLDPRSEILSDLVQKCGVLGGTKSNLTVKYKITLGIRVLMVTISPVISNTLSFLCPLDDASQLGDLLKLLPGAT